MKTLLITALLCLQPALGQVQPINEIFSPEGEFPEDKFVKVAVVQWAPSAAAPLGPQSRVEEHKSRSRATLEEYIREAHAAQAEYIVTPEFATIGYPDIPELPSEEDNFRSREDIKFYVETTNGKNAKFFSELAKELNVWIQIGFPEVDVKTDEYFNSVIVFNTTGELVAHYRKQSLFQLERNYLSKGKENVVFNSPMGKTGLAICSDIYANYVMDKYRDASIDVLSISTSWASYNSGWSHYVSAGSWANSHVLAANHDYFPDSGVIERGGKVQSHIRQTTGVAYGFLPRLAK